MSRMCATCSGDELVEQVRAHALDVHRRGGLERGEALVGEDGELPAAVLGADLPAHPAALLEPGHRVREPAAGGQAAVGELAHPHHPAGRLRQRHEDLVVGVRDAGLVGELAVEPVLQQLACCRARRARPSAPRRRASAARRPGARLPCDPSDTCDVMAPAYWRNTQAFNYATVEQKVKRSTNSEAHHDQLHHRPDPRLRRRHLGHRRRALDRRLLGPPHDGQQGPRLLPRVLRRARHRRGPDAVQRDRHRQHGLDRHPPGAARRAHPLRRLLRRGQPHRA